MSKGMSKGLRGFSPNSRADEHYRHKQWSKKREADHREQVKKKNVSDNLTREAMKMPLYGPW